MTIFTKPAHRAIAVGPPPTVPDPNVLWYKFFENDQASVIPEALGSGHDLNIVSYDSANWVTEAGLPAYHFDGTNPNRGETAADVLHNIGTGDFTVASRFNPRNLAGANATNKYSCCFGRNKGGFLARRATDLAFIADGDSYIRFGVLTVVNEVNWFIWRRTGGTATAFHNDLKGNDMASVGPVENEQFYVALDGFATYTEGAYLEVRVYDYALTDQQCLDLMLLT